MWICALCLFLINRRAKHLFIHLHSVAADCCKCLSRPTGTRDIHISYPSQSHCIHPIGRSDIQRKKNVFELSGTCFPGGAICSWHCSSGAFVRLKNRKCRSLPPLRALPQIGLKYSAQGHSPTLVGHPSPKRCFPPSLTHSIGFQPAHGRHLRPVLAACWCTGALSAGWRLGGRKEEEKKKKESLQSAAPARANHGEIIAITVHFPSLQRHTATYWPASDGKKVPSARGDVSSCSARSESSSAENNGPPLPLTHCTTAL